MKHEMQLKGLVTYGELYCSTFDGVVSVYNEVT